MLLPIVLAAQLTLSSYSPAQPRPDTTRFGPPGRSWVLPTERAEIRAQVVASGIRIPSSIAFLPDGRMLVSDRALGSVWIIDPRTGARDTLRGVPAVHGRVDGGMLDVVPHPDYSRNRQIYLAYAVDGDSGSSTAVDRARLDGTNLVDRERVFLARPFVATSSHFGARIVLRDGYLFISIGDRDQRERAQDLAQHHGKIVRVREDGSVPPDNPFIGRSDALPEIWTYGHRNPQGLTIHPATGDLWAHEHGPRGGDEINIVRRGRNYGWPLITYGREYDGPLVGTGAVQREGMEQPLHYWVPSIAPSGMEFYTGHAFPAWRGHLLSGAMSRGHLNRIVLRDGRVVLEERILDGQGWRIRSVRQGPDGLLYVGVDGGMVLRLSPV